MLRRLMISGLGAALLLAVFAVAAEASPPYITHGKNVPTGVYEDPAWSEACGFPVYVNGADQYTERKYPTKTVFVDKFRGIIYEESHAPLALSEDAVITEDLVTGDQTWNGVAQSISDGGGKPIAKDVGEITFDEEGNIVSERGQHPIADGTAQPAVCAALNS
jgi:hypothetical protein